MLIQVIIVHLAQGVFIFFELFHLLTIIDAEWCESATCYVSPGQLL